MHLAPTTYAQSDLKSTTAKPTEAAASKTDPEAKEQSMECTVKKVIDGDTILILDDQKQEQEVQLEGLDAPELKQPFGKESKEGLTQLLSDATLRITWIKKDNYGRLLGQVYKGDEHCNLTMLQRGLAWHFKRYNQSKVLAAAEEEAREKKVGLWGTEDPVAPWDFRAKNKTPDRPNEEDRK